VYMATSPVCFLKHGSNYNIWTKPESLWFYRI